MFKQGRRTLIEASSPMTRLHLLAHRTQLALPVLCAAALAPAPCSALAVEASSRMPQASALDDADVRQPPEGRRLVEQRCLSCHGERTLEDADFGRLGWHVTVLRMNWVNGAEIRAGEHGMIVDHLRAQSTPSPARIAGEWIMAALLAAGLAFVLWRAIRRWRG